MARRFSAARDSLPEMAVVRSGRRRFIHPESPVNKDEVARMVKKGLELQFETYSWNQMIDDLPLTPEEKAWAKEHTTYAVKVE